VHAIVHHEAKALRASLKLLWLVSMLPFVSCISALALSLPHQLAARANAKAWGWPEPILRVFRYSVYVCVSLRGQGLL